ncbi:acetylxylan esterase [Cellulomonas sp. SLBN-39]|uniref:acetylxylan esterase n=1 Tax=Cellulomonas sp. SLBN-39 TaxID=2768446 RepID=UPI001153A03C|nr:acetylxylan esterase [Cellulomonas sp. SLBN-39]TQL02973.1 cephalosporin-C deacetylase [Cellulomonas sp. SLBN-39]
MPFVDLPLAELERYHPHVPEPEGLDAFWSGTLAAARAAAAPPHAARVTTALELVDTWDVTFSGHGGDPVRGWFTRPAGRDEPLPVVVEYLGYGRGRGQVHERLWWAAAGYAHLLMDTRGQGAQHGTGGDTPDPVGSGPATPGFLTRGIDDPATAYWTRLVTDAVRAVDTARTLPGVDAERVAVSGTSQGGGLAVAVAGLHPHVRAAMVNLPLMCHVERALAITDADPYGEIARHLSVRREDADRVLRTLAHLDGVHLARRAGAATLFSVGLRDAICPPSTVFAAYNAWGERVDADVDRQIVVYPWNGHDGGDALQLTRQLTWLRNHL